MTHRDQIRIEDLGNREFREIAETIGLSVAVDLIRLCGGDRIYIPKMSEVTRGVRNRKIIAESKDTDIKQLARRYDLSVEHVRVILREAGVSAHNRDKTPALPGFE